MLKCLPKGNNCIFRLRQQTSKVYCMYLAFKNIKIISKIGQQRSEIEKETRISFLDVKMPQQKDKCR